MVVCFFQHSLCFLRGGKYTSFPPNPPQDSTIVLKLLRKEGANLK